MRKFGLLVSLLAASTIASATSYDYELTPLIGGVWKEGNLHLDDELVLGAEFQFNDMFESSIKPELSVLYSPSVDYDGDKGDTDFYRVMINGVHEYNTDGSIIPFAKAGLGYEYMSDKHYDNVSCAFVDAGAGVKFPFTEQLALKLEAIYMLKRNDNRWDNNLAGLVGLTFSFGAQEEPVVAATAVAAATAAAVVAAPTDSDNDGVVDTDDKCPDTPTGVKVDANGCPIDSDGDGVADYLDKCPDTPAGVKVDANGCPIDSDGDGVADYLDKCPNSPAGFKVDAEGCPLSMSLTMTYGHNSSKIDAASEEKVTRFATFLKENPGYNVHIIGHTDSSGSAKYNQKLSEKRAESLRTMLVEQGVDASRLSAEGKGESSPLADNETEEGRIANRRIEVELTR